jgi:phosphoribosylanthranilate isomerase
MRIWTKICGITNVDDAEVAIEAGTDAIGVNFHGGSPRCIDTRTAARIVERVAGRVTVYGLFVDVGRDRIEATMKETGIDGVQLHGSEPPDAVEGWRVPVLRAVPVSSRSGASEALVCARSYRVLFDSPRGGGSGIEFDETLLDGLDLSDAVVAGGLRPASVAARVRRLRPFGVDVASGVESAPGRKDPALVREFVKNAKSAG